MKWVTFFLLLISFNLWAKPLVLVSYFDPFGKAKTNNSETVGLELKNRLQNHSDIDIHFCRLSTVFDKSYAEWETCLKALPKKPDLAIGLGETGCDFKMEIMARNLDQTFGPDNEGNERNKTKIVLEGPAAMGFNYPLPQMYCSLTDKIRDNLKISNNAGSFVCNNLAYQVAYFYEEVPFGFMHVPSHHCRNLEMKNKAIVENLETMILSGVKNEAKRLPTLKEELIKLREETRKEKCLNEFYKKAKGIDERSLWPF